MPANPLVKHSRHFVAATLLLATTLALPNCSVTYGQDNQDRSKRIQVEGPLENVLNGIKLNNPAHKTTAKQKPTLGFPISIGKADIELPVETLLKTVAMPPSLENNLDTLKSTEAFAESLKSATIIPPSNGAFSKGTIETPPKLLLDLAATELALPTDESNAKSVQKNKPTASDKQPNVSTDKRNNPAVQPGRVNWHVDLATATQRSKRSGKPIFHFQLLGQLDQRFT